MFYDNLSKECERQGLKITPIVQECGGASGSIAAWKKGSSPNSDIVLKLSMRLNVSCDYLLTGNDYLSEKSETITLSTDADVVELITNYKKLDSRGQHRLHTVCYEELDRVEKLNPIQSDDELPRVPFAASGWDNITPENDAIIQEKLQQFEKRARELKGG